MAISWGSMIQGATNALRGGDKKKDKTRSGKEIATAITKKESQRGPIVKSKSQIQASTKVIPTQKLVPAASLSTESTGVSSIDKVLDSIDSKLASITSTVRNTNKVQEKSARDEAKKVGARKKGMREKILESTAGFMGALSSKVPSGVKKTWMSIKKFLTNVILGSLVLYIVQQWDSIVSWYEKTIEKIKELWIKLKPIVLKLWDFLKGFVRFTVDWTARLMGIKEPDTKPIADNLKEIGKKMEGIGELWKGFTGMIDKLRGIEKSEKPDTMEEGNLMPSMHHDAPPPADPLPDCDEPEPAPPATTNTSALYVCGVSLATAPSLIGIQPCVEPE